MLLSNKSCNFPNARGTQMQDKWKIYVLCCNISCRILARFLNSLITRGPRPRTVVVHTDLDRGWRFPDRTEPNIGIGQTEQT